MTGYQLFLVIYWRTQGLHIYARTVPALVQMKWTGNASHDDGLGAAVNTHRSNSNTCWRPCSACFGKIISHYILSTRVHISSSNKFRMLFDNLGISLLCLQLIRMRGCRLREREDDENRVARRIRGWSGRKAAHTYPRRTLSPVFVESSFQIHKTFAIYLLLCVVISCFFFGCREWRRQRRRLEAAHISSYQIRSNWKKSFNRVSKRDRK